MNERPSTIHPADAQQRREPAGRGGEQDADGAGHSPTADASPSSDAPRTSNANPGQDLRHPRLSVVIPLHDEEESLPELAQRLHAALSGMVGDSYEVIFVDDGSEDGSFDVIRRLAAENPRIHAVRFRTNYGKSAALAVGFARARGEIVFTMDADLQDDPAELPLLLEKLESGYDLVSGWKKVRHDPWHKTLPSKLFNSVVSNVTGLHIHDFNCGLKVYRREVLPELNVYGEMHRYLPAQAHWQGFRVTELPVLHHPRKHGVSKFGIERFLKGFLDLLTLVLTMKYARRPLHVFGTVGTIVALLGFFIDLWLTIEWMLGQTALTNRPLALLGVLLIIVGVQLISIGLVGEMIAKSTLSNEQYSIRETIG